MVLAVFHTHFLGVNDVMLFLGEFGIVGMEMTSVAETGLNIFRMNCTSFEVQFLALSSELLLPLILDFVFFFGDLSCFTVLLLVQCSAKWERQKTTKSSEREHKNKEQKQHSQGSSFQGWVFNMNFSNSSRWEGSFMVEWSSSCPRIFFHFLSFTSICQRRRRHTAYDDEDDQDTKTSYSGCWLGAWAWGRQEPSVKSSKMTTTDCHEW